MPALLKIAIASPCSANWNLMPGDDRVRHCPECKLDVYNFSAMTSAEVDQVIARRSGRLCARFYQRTDGTMLTQNCPLGFRASIRRASRAAAATLTALVSITPAMAKPSGRQSPTAQVEATAKAFAIHVVDPANGFVSNAAVSMVNQRTGERIDAITDTEGRVHLPDLPPGFYDLTVSAPGFDTSRQKHVDASAGIVTVRIQLAALMGDVVYIIPTESSVLPDQLKSLTQPTSTSAVSNTPEKASFLRRVFSKLRRTL